MGVGWAWVMGGLSRSFGVGVGWVGLGGCGLSLGDGWVTRCG